MRYLLTDSEITEPFSYLNCQEMLNRVKFPLVDRFTDKRRSNKYRVADKENTYHKTQKGKPIPKQKHRLQNGNTRTRITKYNIESYNLKKKTESFP